VILGLPGESDQQILQTADRLAELPLDFVKIHDLHVVRGTALGREYQQSLFPLRSRQETIDLLVRFIERIPPGMALMRLFSHTPPQLLMAPTWDTDPNRMIRDIRAALEKKDTWQGRLCSAGASGREAGSPLPNGAGGA
jgi:hypothetical protein